MARPSLALHCPKSSLAWRTGTRARRGRDGELSATCPSCGMGLVVRITVAGLELVRGRTASGPAHEVIAPTRTPGGLHP